MIDKEITQSREMYSSMLYLHDVWVNWFEGEENGYNVCHFHEWKKEDVIELLDQVPLIKVERVLFNYIENQLSDIPQKLLEDVYQKAFVRKQTKRYQLDYCFIITDGYGILAVDTIGYAIPIKKSRLIPRQEQLVFEMIQTEPTKIYKFNSKGYEKEYHILSPSFHMMLGLTRKERQLKQLLFMALDQLYISNNEAQLRYWLTEWDPATYEQSKEMGFEQLWNYLYENLQVGWSERQAKFCEKLVKGNQLFERIWEMESKSRVNEKY